MQLIRDQILGLKSAIQTARETERLFIKSNTLSEAIEKARSDFQQIEEELEEAKQTKASLKTEKFAMLKEACDPLSEKISSLLPHGFAVIRMEEELFIGWGNEDRITPYNGLSGGERVFFDCALSNSLLTGKGHKILVLEAAELDEPTLAGTLLTISEANPDAQVLVLTCHAPKEVPECWKVVNLLMEQKGGIDANG